jgi:hypothetical protein
MVLQLLPNQSYQDQIGKYDDFYQHRKTITMERHHFGLGDKYFK